MSIVERRLDEGHTEVYCLLFVRLHSYKYGMKSYIIYPSEEESFFNYRFSVRRIIVIDSYKTLIELLLNYLVLIFKLT